MRVLDNLIRNAIEAMLGINGIELVSTIKENKDIPFVLYTGRESE